MSGTEPMLLPSIPPSILGSMRPDGSRRMVHPADLSGRFLTARRAVFALLVAFYLAAPFVPIGGRPMIRLDVEHRRFFLFGGTFNSQDVWLVVLIALSFVFALLFVTAWRGRIWCGWACPQTVFLEAFFRPLERFIDGPRERRLKLESANWSGGKLLRRVVKLALYAGLSLGLGHAAAAIFVGPRELAGMILDGPAAHRLAFGLSTGFAVLVFVNFAWFREQFCVVLCPYGRLQSVLHDRDSITVAYDAQRGEPRGRRARSAPLGERTAGDCVDCHRCVVVCPTAIDIRNGLQMECLACVQCADACDEVMVKIGRPTGLIRMMSQTEQVTGARRFVRPRLALYATLLLLAAGTLGASLVRRSPFEVNLLRPRGSNPFTLDGERVLNAVELHLVNKHPETVRFTIRVESPVPAEVVVGTPAVELASLADARIPISISVATSAIQGPLELRVVVEDGAGAAARTIPYRFLSPFALSHPPG